jgi:hypothetical protein
MMMKKLGLDKTTYFPGDWPRDFHRPCRQETRSKLTHGQEFDDNFFQFKEEIDNVGILQRSREATTILNENFVQINSIGDTSTVHGVEEDDTTQEEEMVYMRVNAIAAIDQLNVIRDTDSVTTVHGLVIPLSLNESAALIETQTIL